MKTIKAIYLGETIGKTWVNGTTYTIKPVILGGRIVVDKVQSIKNVLSYVSIERFLGDFKILYEEEV